MNIALPTFVIILGLLPGILFFHSYFSGRFTRQVAGLAGISEVALYVIFAVPLDAASLWAASRVGLTFDFGLTARLLLGLPTDITATRLAERISSAWAVQSVSYLATLLLAVLTGGFLRKLVWAARLDVLVPLLQMKHEWYYMLLGRLRSLPWSSVVPYTDVLVQHANETQLYQGILSGFELARDGSISRLMLTDAYRGRERGPAFNWKQIPGDKFVVIGSCIRSLNMRYAVLEEKVEPTRIARVKRRVRTYWRRFWVEEP